MSMSRTRLYAQGYPDEAWLIARAIENDGAAVRLIMQRNNRRLYRIARSVVRDDSEAEDVVQEAYGRAFTRLRQFRGASSIGTWLARIVLNEALARLRRRRETVDWSSIENQHAQIIPFPLVAAQPDPERTMAQREIRELLERAIDDLPDAFRLVLVARAIEGMSIEDTAELLGIRPETVKTRLHRARTLLRAKLEHDVGPSLTESFPFEGERCERITSSVLDRLKLLQPNPQLTGGRATSKGDVD
jgi:RNA polymerase sigma-70 factor (ECF subfamily)